MFRAERQEKHTVTYLRQPNRDVPAVDGEEPLDVDDNAFLLPFAARLESPQDSGRLEVCQAEVVGGARMGE